MTVAIKTISMPLITDTIDMSLLENMFEGFRIVYDETAKRMPSLPKYLAKRRVGVPYNHWYKEFRRLPGVDLPAHTALEAVMKAREAYASMQSNKNYNSISQGRGNCVRFHNQQFRFMYEDDQYFVTFPTRAGYGSRISIPILRNLYCYEVLDAVMKGMKHGTAELIRHSDTCWFHLTVKWEVKIHPGITPVGVDFGMRNIAVACTLDHNHMHVRLWSGREAQHRRREYKRLMSIYQRKGLLTKVRGKKRRYRHFMKTKNHQVSREVIEFAKQFDRPIIVLENLHQFRKQADWTFAELRTFIEYKAMHAGMPVVAVDPKNTSKECNRCGHIDSDSRPHNGIIFSCVKCGYTVNADVNAAINLAKKNENIHRFD